MIDLRRTRLPVVALTACLLSGAVGATWDRDEARRFLATAFSLTASDFGRLEAGQVVSRTLPASDKREVATFGVVRIRMTPEFYVSRLNDIRDFKQDEAVLQIGAFSQPPALSDVATLTLDIADVRSLRACRVGDCGLQLSADGIERFQRDVDWRAADAHQQAERLMRRILVESVTAYVTRGATATMEYADQAERMSVGREFVSLAGSDAAGWKPFSDLRQHLFDFPATDTPGTVDRMYWSKEKVGRRAVVSVTHLAIMRTAGETSADYAVASKQVYGSHYYDASLGLTVLVRDRRAATPITYLVYLNRSRVDVFGGLLGPMTRHIVTSKARGTVANQLGRLQRTLERQFATAASSRRP
jgi:hypothetical protein